MLIAFPKYGSNRVIWQEKENVIWVQSTSPTSVAMQFAFLKYSSGSGEILLSKQTQKEPFWAQSQQQLWNKGATLLSRRLSGPGRIEASIWDQGRS